MNVNLFGLFKAHATAPVARERLQILLAHERLAVGPGDLVAVLRDELIATIARHIDIDPEKVIVRMDRAGSVSMLEIDVEIPSEKIVGDGKRRPTSANYAGGGQDDANQPQRREASAA